MGNCKSCIDDVPQTATIIDVSGRLRQIKVPITAAEIMLDEIGHVISSEQLIQRTRRVTLMKADEELRAGNIYLLVPSARANSRVSRSEMKLMDNARGSKRGRCKILSTETTKSGGVDRLPTLALEDVTGSMGTRVSYSCPWRPALDPIIEENGSSKVKRKANNVLIKLEQV